MNSSVVARIKLAGGSAKAVVNFSCTGGGKVADQRVDHVMVARLLEVGHDDILGIGFGGSAGLAH